MSDDSIAWCCVATADYDPQLAVFLNSLREHLPGAPVIVFRPDRSAPSPQVASLATFDTLDIDIRGTPGTPGVPTWAEIAYAAKPYALASMLNRGHARVIYADADLWMLARPESLLASMADADLLVTPQIVGPLRLPDHFALERALLDTGTFNTGLVGVSASDVGRAFCAWWGERTASFSDRVYGRASDQRWCNFVTGCFPSAHVLQCAGVNLGPWRIGSVGEFDHDAVGGVRWRGESVELMHMSGFDPADPSRISRHRPDLVAAPGTPLRLMAERYATRLLAARAAA